MSSTSVQCIKALHLVHRLIYEGSDLVLTLCCNKLDFFRQIASFANDLPVSDFCRGIATAHTHYLVKKLEFHQAFEGCFEGSYSLDMYFQKLRLEGKKLQIGAADSPFRRQVVPSLLELQTCAIALLERLMTIFPYQPELTTLSLRSSIPVLSDLCALLLLLQYVTTKLLATKTNFDKAIEQYEDNYGKMLKIFARFSSIAASAVALGFPAAESEWARRIKLPTLGPTAPPIVKGSTSVNSPPSLDPTSAPTARSHPNAIIFDPILSESEQREASWMWTSFVLAPSHAESSPEPSGNNNSQSGSPSLHIPASTVGQTPSLHHSMGSDPSLSARAPIVNANSSPAFIETTPTFTVSNMRASGGVPQSYTPPPAFAVSGDPFSAPQSHAIGFTQGDPFSSSDFPTQFSNDFSGDFAPNAGGYASSGSNAMFTPSTTHGTTLVQSGSFGSSGSGYLAPVGTGMKGSDSFGFESEVPFSPNPAIIAMTPPPKRALASSVDQMGANTGQRLHAPAQAKGHKKRPSDSSSSSSSHAASSSSPISRAKHMGHSHVGSTGSNSSDSTLTSEEKLKNKDQVNAQVAEFAAIQEKKCNQTCFDCGDLAPKWISLNLGVFICYRCSGVHRSFGTHITKVRSVQLDVLTTEQIDVFKRMGNHKAAKVWLANVPEDRTPPDRNTSQMELERFLRDKYVFEEFKIKDADATKKKKHSRTLSHQ